MVRLRPKVTGSTSKPTATVRRDAGQVSDALLNPSCGTVRLITHARDGRRRKRRRPGPSGLLDPHPTPRPEIRVRPTGRVDTDIAMPKLSRPTVGVHQSFVAAMAEFRAEGRGSAEDRSMIGSELREFSRHWSTPAGFASYVDWLRNQSLEDSPRPDGHVPSTTLWWTQDDAYLGRLAIRHRLTPYLRDFGGHIGYDVRPTARRQGHATAMLAAALSVAYHLDITSALVTCDVDNVASRRVIERNGGIFADQRSEKLRFWVPTG